ncbi:MAG: diguanylate cyclase [Anaerolineales bacterium]|nr:diguanylate cyclase [Anaerolineales bacterium]MCX7609339.1 diguanylate cyclase [Anaerolineales bacterium]MDW8227624.1 diguanylate cyclase [Anaerolineales bacterium]
MSHPSPSLKDKQDVQHVELEKKNRLLEHIFLTINTPIYIYDFERGRLEVLNRAMPTFLGYPIEQLVNMSTDRLRDLLYSQDVERTLEHYQRCRQATDGEILETEYRFRHAYGEWHWIAVRETPFERSPDGKVSKILGVAEDITSGRLAEERVAYLRTHDPLTGLYNRSYYYEELARLERGRRFPVTIILADIDGLKKVNQTRGFQTGDALIRSAAELLKSCFRTEDIVARIGGDKFAILLPEMAAISADALLLRIQRKLDLYNATHPQTTLHLSLGIATAESNQELRSAIIEAEHRLEEHRASKQN